MNVCSGCALAAKAELGLVAVDPERMHSTCTGPSTCDCSCEYAAVAHCVECGRVGTELDDGRQCTDRADCAKAIVAQYIEAHTRPPKSHTAASRSRDASQGGLCLCGCGAAVTRRFLPGHDAKLAGRLVRDARAGDYGAVERLRELGWSGKIPTDVLVAFGPK